MAVLRREVLSSVPGWRRPQSLIGLFFASLLFATSVDALLLAYRLRAAEAAEWQSPHVIQVVRARRVQAPPPAPPPVERACNHQ